MILVILLMKKQLFHSPLNRSNMLPWIELCIAYMLLQSCVLWILKAFFEYRNWDEAEKRWNVGNYSYHYNIWHVINKKNPVYTGQPLFSIHFHSLPRFVPFEFHSDWDTGYTTITILNTSFVFWEFTIWDLLTKNNEPWQ